jgi:hypothetical protein
MSIEWELKGFCAAARSAKPAMRNAAIAPEATKFRCDKRKFNTAPTRFLPFQKDLVILIENPGE